MKIRCGSHQQNRSIVRPGLSLMATKVALTAEEFRENSQRSIDLFNTEKLSTDSTHVLKSAYCILCISAVAICTERVEAKVAEVQHIVATCVAICTERVEAKDSVEELRREKIVAICTERVEAKAVCLQKLLRVSVAICTERVEAKFQRCDRCVEALPLQSARSVWRQSIVTPAFSAAAASCNLHGACGGKAPAFRAPEAPPGCNLHGACGGKGQYGRTVAASAALQSARSVWRQRLINCSIYVDFLCCNLHGACGGKAPQIH